MPAAKTILTSTQASGVAIFNEFKSHCNAPRVETRNNVLKMIRDAYPDYHVTEVDERRVSLFEFAAADKALLIFDAEDESFNASRKWTSVGNGVEKRLHPGTLIDEFRFARYVVMPNVAS